MPRKAKEKIDEIEKKDEKKSVVKKTGTKTSAKTGTKAKVGTKPKVEAKVKAETKTKATPKKKTATRKSVLAQIIENIDNEPIKEKKESKSKGTKKATTKKASTKKPTVKKSTAKKSKNSVQILEYYDLPYKYGNTVVKLLAQTPKTLFVYWEVSDSDIENFKKAYGEDFFNKTKPFLIVHNLTLNTTSEIEINDFANCWYLNTDDTDCKFDIELARKYVDSSSKSFEDDSDYLYIAESNDLQSPNNHILFEKIQEFVVFRNANNNNIIKKNIKSFKFLKDIYKFYKDMYDEDVLNNPSSQFKF